MGQLFSYPERAELLSVKLDLSGPVELAALSDGLHALASHHARFAERAGATVGGDKVRLYVREIRSGSIIVDLIALAQTYGDEIKTIVLFGRALVDLLQYGTGKASQPPPGTTPADARDMSTFVAPVASDANGAMVITVTNSAGVTINTLVTSNEANATQNRLRNWSADQVRPLNGVHEGMLLVFDRATGDPEKITGDLARIERLSPRPVKTIFASPELKAAVVTEALFQKAYIVDVDVQSIDGKPRLYKILRMAESFDRPD